METRATHMSQEAVTIMAGNDAIASTVFIWEYKLHNFAPCQICVYADAGNIVFQVKVDPRIFAVTLRYVQEFASDEPIRIEVVTE